MRLSSPAYPPSVPQAAPEGDLSIYRRFAASIAERSSPHFNRNNQPSCLKVGGVVVFSAAVPFVFSTLTALLAHSILISDEPSFQVSRADFLRPASVGAAIFTAIVAPLLLREAFKEREWADVTPQLRTSVEITATTSLISNFGCVPVGVAILHAAGYAKPPHYGDVAGRAIAAAATMSVILGFSSAIFFKCLFPKDG